jgi:hypothetical protein
MVDSESARNHEALLDELVATRGQNEGSTIWTGATIDDWRTVFKTWELAQR